MQTGHNRCKQIEDVKLISRSIGSGPDTLSVRIDSLVKSSDTRSKRSDSLGISPDTPEKSSDIRSKSLDTPVIGPNTPRKGLDIHCLPQRLQVNAWIVWVFPHFGLT